ncbi:MAG: hypothetical protein CVV25_05580 [Ignavibacteriae bacterium HGW-Ignavibacteriae-4]|jgi:hypothetical protein|nr:MAG: hypothetical protein CVV25_05580 [Ignavibacteriae bacterium HGW-Ignavibacteriae-4]
MKYYLQILLILLPTILLSAEWEKVDLPNLNNGQIYNAHFIDGNYVLQKWDSRYISSSNLIDWEELDTSYTNSESFKRYTIDSVRDFEKEFSYLNKYYDKVNFGKSGAIFFKRNDSTIKFSTYNDIRKNIITDSLVLEDNNISIINSLDDSFYFYRDSTLYLINNNVKSDKSNKFIIDSIRMNYRIDIIKHAFQKNDILYLIREYHSYCLQNILTVQRVHLDSLEIEGEIRLNKKVLADSKLYILNDFLFVSSEFSYNFYNIDSLFKTSVNFSNSYLNQLWYFNVDNGILKTNNYNNNFQIDYSLESKELMFTFYCLNPVGKQVLIKKKRKLWEFYYDFAKNNNGYYLLLFDNKDNIIKNLQLIYPSKDFDNLIISYSDKKKCVVKTRDWIWEIDRKKLIVIDSIFTDNPLEYCNGVVYEKNRSYRDKGNENIEFNYSYDFGKSWNNFKINIPLSDMEYPDWDVVIENGHELFFQDTSAYSFTNDSIYWLDVKNNKYELIGSYLSQHTIMHNNYIYFIDKRDNKIKKLINKEKIVSISDKLPITKEINRIDIDNGYLYATDLYNLYRLKLE